MMIEFTTPSRRYIVASYGNGWAYNVTDQETGEEFFVQDHDAQQLQEESKHFLFLNSDKEETTASTLFEHSAMCHNQSDAVVAPLCAHVLCMRDSMIKNIVFNFILKCIKNIF